MARSTPRSWSIQGAANGERTLDEDVGVDHRFDRSAYDAAYLALAEMTERPLITGDRRLYNAVHERLDCAQWIGDYPQAG